MITLPHGLEAWRESLSGLDPVVAEGLGPLIKGVDALLRQQDGLLGRDGPLDGYDGLTTRGDVSRLLASEWLLADELPMEFLRRAASRELLHHDLAFRAAPSAGRVIALVDTGPDQLGAPRLVQLAALVVLHRRALDMGTDLVLGMLGEPVDNWFEGDLPGLVRAWRKARRSTRPTIADVGDRDAALAADDEVWVLTGPALAAGLGRRRHVLASAEGDWDEHGVRDVSVALREASRVLALPGRDLGVRALRGSDFVRRTAGVSRTSAGTVLRCPTFSSQDRRLLLRGEGLSELVVVTIDDQNDGSPRPRRHRFPGPVIAAASLHRRVVGLAAVNGELRATVIGKALGGVDGLVVPYDGPLPTDEERLDPLYYYEQGLLCRLNSEWVHLKAGLATPLRISAVGPGPALHHPQLEWGSPQRRLLLGPDDFSAVLKSDGRWSCRRAQAPEELFFVEGDALAVVQSPSGFGVLTRSLAGHLLRVVDADGTRTLTRWSGGIGLPAVHPSLPWIAVQREVGLVEVGNYLTDEVIQLVRADRL